MGGLERISWSTAVLKDNSKESMKTALLELAEFDSDFNGDNGDEYLWDEAKEAGYENNAKYVTDEVLKTYDGTNVKETVKNFVSITLDGQGMGCYGMEDESIEIISTGEGLPKVILLILNYYG